LREEVNAKRMAECAASPSSAIIIARSGEEAGGGGLGSDGTFALATVSLSLIDLGLTWQLLAHELGHALFSLLDEYPGDGPDTDYLPGINIADETEAKQKTFAWEAIRTSEDVFHCPKKGSGDPPPGYIGLVEGGFYSKCDYYRAERFCRMRAEGDVFCHACALRVRNIVSGVGSSFCNP
jgi:hypothetical protein